jgi:hypothetical protein
MKWAASIVALMLLEAAVFGVLMGAAWYVTARLFP